ncbi:TDP-N-acetylfucosamine:lipid II N-acetylfucosaminyltransferase [Serratia sp. BW106]|uniref:TDP-N-acetylfucosamine:lipid II N-acetylfucosaminyltransferase n=1 Tax=Serratia sp. BW106 TaxID=1884636 RepID=UPI000BFFE8CA|nr:TDP-N-acetylfucosamine:lipid II N-acetylfucosaminyltransferase [Serratia sp. BW106]
MKKIKILHLCTDEKFIDRAINIFEMAYPEQNTLCVYSKGKKISHIKREVDFKVGIKESLIGIDFAKVGSFDVLVVHSLRDFWFRTIEKLDNGTPVVWLGWGYDYYDLIGGNDRWLLKDTLLFSQNMGENKNWKQRIKNAFLFLSKRRLSVIEKIQFFSPVIPDEYGILKNSRKWRHFPEQVDWNYGAAEKDLSCYVSDMDDGHLIGGNVLVGNSATSTNNHLEIFNFLKNVNLQGRKFIVPLNYGDMEYGVRIQKVARDKLGVKADILADFMPIEEYMEKISSCGFVIMNHVRQQGVGNIISMIYMGAKIFLREENPTFNFLKNKGVVIFSVQELERNYQLLSATLTNHDVISNREIIERIWSNAALLEKTKKLISILVKKNGKI